MIGRNPAVSTALGLLATFASATAVAAKAPEPSQGREDFPGCRWSEVQGARLSIWSFACGSKQGGAHLVADDGLPGFVLVEHGPDGPSRRVVVRAFRKPATAPVEAALSAIRAASPGKHTATCTLRASKSDQDHAAPRYTLEPTGAARIAWEASAASSVEPDMPCGPLGVAYVGDRYFQALAGDPTAVVFLDMGSEVQIFDPNTLKRRGK